MKQKLIISVIILLLIFSSYGQKGSIDNSTESELEKAVKEFIVKSRIYSSSSGKYNVYFVEKIDYSEENIFCLKLNCMYNENDLAFNEFKYFIQFEKEYILFNDSTFSKLMNYKAYHLNDEIYQKVKRKLFQHQNGGITGEPLVLFCCNIRSQFKYKIFDENEFYYKNKTLDSTFFKQYSIKKLR
jgi:hypothetical protein